MTNSNLTIINRDGEVILQKCNKNIHGEVIIPDNVTIIGEKDCVLFKKSVITSIKIPASVKHINRRALSCCPHLTSIVVEKGNKHYDSRDNCNAIIETKTNTLILGCKSTNIPNSVTSIGDYAFTTSQLTQIAIPTSITDIGDHAFENCSKLTSISIKSPIIKLGDQTFKNCKKLESFSCTKIDENSGEDIFDGCNSLQVEDGIRFIANFLLKVVDKSLSTISFPKSTTVISKNAFADCKNITSVNLPTSIIRIDDNAFANCTNLQSIGISSVKRIGANSFMNCIHLKSIEIPDQVTIIKSNTFSNCKTLSTIVLPDAITSIGTSAFANCSTLSTLTIPNSINSIGDGAFQGCSSLTSIDIPDLVTRIGINTFANCTALSCIKLSTKLRSIGEYAFANCSVLTSINIPASCQIPPTNAFKDCEQLIVGGIMYADNYLLKVVDKSLSAINIKEGTKTICDSAFEGCEELTYVNIPESVFWIGDNAFEGCFNLTSIQFPISLEHIGNQVFYDCKKLQTLYIPKNVSSIGHSLVFSYDEPSLTKIEVDPNNKIYDSRNSCNAIIETKSNKLILGCSQTIIPNSVTCIGEGAFLSINYTCRISIPNSVIKIEDNAFRNGGCNEVPDSVEDIGTNVFLYNCSSLTIGRNVKKIGDYGLGKDLYDLFCYAESVPDLGIQEFEPDYVEGPVLHVPAHLQCKYLKKWGNIFDDVVTINDEIHYVTTDNDITENIDESAFGATVISNTYSDGKGIIKFDGHVTRIGGEAFGNAFARCENLKKIYLPDSVEHIEKSGFVYCSNLQEINLSDSVKAIGEIVFGGPLKITIRLSIAKTILKLHEKNEIIYKYKDGICEVVL